jgi:hypothetical protein
MLKTCLLAFVVLALPVSTAFAQDAALTVTFADPAWTGETIPEGQQCPLQGGSGATPALHVVGVPAEATAIEVAFNDETYIPMNDGGHGILRFAVTPENNEVELPSVPGNTADNLPEGVTVKSAARGEGDYASPGYLPPCSGGQGNTYTATVLALAADDRVVGHGTLTLGKY